MDKVVSAWKSAPVPPPSPAMADAVALFSSAHAALMFAFNFTHGTLKRPSISVLATKGGGGGGKGLAGLDGAAQSGMIQAEVGFLSAVRQQILGARFRPQSAPCACKSACCRGMRDDGEWGMAIAWLTEWVLAQGLTATISHHRLRRAVVMRYFGRHESLIAIAEACHVNRDTASELNKRVVERFRSEERGGMHEIEARLKKAGIVISSS
jgi:hypothetical protein